MCANKEKWISGHDADAITKRELAGADQGWRSEYIIRLFQGSEGRGEQVYCSNSSLDRRARCANRGIRRADRDSTDCHVANIKVGSRPAVGQPSRGQQLICVGCAGMDVARKNQSLSSRVAAAELVTRVNHQVGKAVQVDVRDSQSFSEVRPWAREREIIGLRSRVRENEH